MTSKRTLTQADVDFLKEEFKEDFPTKKDFEDFRSKFFDKIDPILKEVTTAREERPLIEHRIETLEEIHPKGKHSPAL